MKSVNWTVLLLLTVFLGIPALVQNTNEAPYIYYYSSTEGAFIIELADGTDSRTLISFEIPSPINALGDGFLVGPGWSSSGEWFAWSYWSSNGAPSHEAFLVNRDGARYRQFFDGENLDATHLTEIVRNMSWHPTQDLLLFQGQALDGEDASVYVYDPQQDAFVLDFNSNEQLETGFIQNVFWSATGQYITLMTSRSANIISLQGEALAIYDFNYTDTGETRPLFDWHSSHDWFLTYERAAGGALGIIHVGNAHSSELRQIAVCPRDSFSCYGWLP